MKELHYRLCQRGLKCNAGAKNEQHYAGQLKCVDIIANIGRRFDADACSIFMDGVGAPFLENQEYFKSQESVVWNFKY
jgi:hypothetical protein